MTQSTIDNLQYKIPRPLPLQPAEVELLKVRRMPMDEWAEANYVLTEMTASTPGAWRNEYTTFLVEPMRRLSAPGPAEVTVMACTQGGKTELGNIFLGYVIDQCPAPFMIIMPNRYTAKRRVNVRYRAMFEGCPRLKMRLPGGSVENLNIGSETILSGMPLYLGYAGSPAALADVPVCCLHIDEVVLFPLDSGGEGEPTKLAERRTRTFRLRRKILTTSSGGVVGDVLDVSFAKGTECEWWARCPRCSRYHQMEWDRVGLAHDDDGRLLGSEAYKDDANSFYECPHCQAHWSERERGDAVAAGEWVPRGMRIDASGRRFGQGKRTNHFSCRITAWMLHPRFQTIAGLAEEWAQAMAAKKAGNIAPLRDFITKQKGESWEERGREIDEDRLAKKINKKLHKRCVPNTCRCVVMGADYHEDETGQVRIDYTTKAFAPGMISSTVDAGSVDSFEALDRVIFKSPLVWVEDSESPEPAIIAVFIDSGFYPDKIYTWCRKHKGLAWPTKGVQTQRIPLDIKELDKVMEDAKRRARRAKAKRYTGMHLIHVDTSHFKDQVSSWCEAEIGSEGSTEFFAELPEWYLAELCAEHKVQEKRGSGIRFVWVSKGGKPSHSLDTEVAAAAAAHFCKAYAMGMDEKRPAMKRRVGRIERFRK